MPHACGFCTCCPSHKAELQRSQKLSSATAGGSAGIDRAVALKLNDNGAVVTVLADRKDRLDAVVQNLHRVAHLFLGMRLEKCAPAMRHLCLTPNSTVSCRSPQGYRIVADLFNIDEVEAAVKEH